VEKMEEGYGLSTIPSFTSTHHQELYNLTNEAPKEKFQHFNDNTFKPRMLDFLDTKTE
jgi:hypothetical protein